MRHAPARIINNNMQLSEPAYEMRPEEVVTRDIAEHYIRIQENTEFCSNIVRHQHGRVYPAFSPDTPNIEPRTFFNLIVQSAYLLYTCCIRKVAVYLSRELFTVYKKDTTIEVITEFLLEQEFNTFDQEKRKYIEANFKYVNPFKYENAYAENVLTFIRNYLEAMKNYLRKLKDRKIVVDRNYIRQLESLESTVGLLFSILQKGLKPKALISCLEETEVFRTYSCLLKTLNCSLYETLRKTGKFEQLVQQIKRKELILSERFNYMLQQNSLDYQALENGIEDFIKFLVSINLIEIDMSMTSNTNSNDSTKERSGPRLGTSQVYKHGDRVYTWKILVEEKKIRQFNQKMLLQLAEGNTTTVVSNEEGRTSQNLFHIEYMSKRNLISVWYVSNIEVNIENSDALMYHCNNMMIELNNMSVEHTERDSAKNNKRKERVLAFKVITNFNFKENPLINLMLLIDRAMIYGKVCEPEIAKKATKVEDFSRFNLVSKRINHLSNLFIKKIRRLYESISIKGRQI